MMDDNQNFANDFDLDLYRLAGRAERRDHIPEWAEIYRRLSAIRPAVRAMMSEEDREATQ